MITYDKLIKKHYILQQRRINPFKAKKPFEPFEGFGIECGKGWYNLLDVLCTKIEKELDKNKKLKKEFRVSQIKEKFGGLRFYIGCSTDVIDKLIDEAEERSYTVCENCGESAVTLSIRGWISTLCKNCSIAELQRWKKDVIGGIDKAESTINIFKGKESLTNEESMELSDAQEWFTIGDNQLKEIHKKMNKI